MTHNPFVVAGRAPGDRLPKSLRRGLPRGVLLSAAAAALVCLGAPDAHAQGKSAGDVKKECIASYEATQSLRDSGKLVEAREQAISCARAECPKALNTECMGWLGEIEKSTPSVVLAAKGPSGEDLTGVKVSVDGKLVTEELGVRAIPVDPGKHEFRFESADHGSKAVEVVLREGEKNRTVSVSFAPEKPAEVPVAPPPTATPAPRAEGEGGGPPLAFWVLGGAGVASLAVGTVFEIMGLSKKSDLEECKPSCAAEDADAMTRNFVVGDVALVAGGVAVGAALVVLLVGGDDDAGATTAGLEPVIVASPWGAFGGVSARF